MQANTAQLPILPQLLSTRYTHTRSIEFTKSCTACLVDVTVLHAQVTSDMLAQQTALTFQQTCSQSWLDASNKLGNTTTLSNARSMRLLRCFCPSHALA